MTRAMVRCDRCQVRARLNRAAADNWNAVWHSGRLTGYLCSACQTAEEHAEAEIHAAVYDYGRATADSLGRIRIPLKS